MMPSIEKHFVKGKMVMFSQNNTALRWSGILIAAIAGAWTLFHLIWNFAGNKADDYWGIALLILFFLALILAFVEYAQERSDLRANAGNEAFPEPAISRFFLGSAGSSPFWFVIRMDVGAQWLLAGWEKITTPGWGTSGKALAGFVAGALAKSSGANPAVQGWYASFLQHYVLPNVGLFSFLVTWGEFAVGLGILLGILTGIAAGFGVLLGISWRGCGWIGVDRWLLPMLGLPWKPGALFRPQEMPVTASRL